MLGVEIRTIVAPKSFKKPQDIFLIVSKKNSSLKLVFWKNLNDFFQYFQFKSNSCDYEGTKSFTECYRSDALQNWTRNIHVKMLNHLLSYSGQIF